MQAVPTGEDVQAEMDDSRRVAGQDLTGAHIQHLLDYMWDTNTAMSTQTNVPETIKAFALRVIDYMPRLIESEQKRDTHVVEEVVRQWTQLLELQDIEIMAQMYPSCLRSNGCKRPRMDSASGVTHRGSRTH